MSTTTTLEPIPSPTPVLARRSRFPAWLTWLAIGLAAVGLLFSMLLWQKLSTIQEELARRSADSSTQALQARSSAQQAQEAVRDIATRQIVQEARLSEVSLQRNQLEELMQSVSRSRDENLVVDLDASLRLAQQQAQLTGSIEPLLAALKAAERRLSHVAQPRLSPVLRALAKDITRVKAATLTDTPGLLVKIDETVRLMDDVALLNAVGPEAMQPNRGPTQAVKPVAAQPATWWEPVWENLHKEWQQLLRVRRIDQPEALLLSPQQSFFLRENLKLQLLNIRLSVLARQYAPARAQLETVQQALSKYVDLKNRKGQAALQAIKQLQEQLQWMELPRIDDTLGALATAGAGR